MPFDESSRQECESYKNVLIQFSEQSPSDGNVTALLSKLRDLCESTEAHKRSVEHQSRALEKLAENAAARLDQYASSDAQSQFQSEASNDRQTIAELRQQVERLTEELQDDRMATDNSNSGDDSSDDCSMEDSVDSGK